MSVKLPREELEFRTWFVTEYYDDKGCIKITVRLNSYIREEHQQWTCDMGRRGARRRLERLRRRAEKRARYLNRAVAVSRREVDDGR